MLYEDAPRGPEFQLHELVVAAVCDAAEADHWQIAGRIEGRALKGATKVVEAVRSGDRIARRGEPIYVLLDSDRVREQLGLPPGASADQVEEHVASVAPPGTEVRLHLLDRNLETLLRALLDCGVDALRGPPRDAGRR